MALDKKGSSTLHLFSPPKSTQVALRDVTLCIPSRKKEKARERGKSERILEKGRHIIIIGDFSTEEYFCSDGSQGLLALKFPACSEIN